MAKVADKPKNKKGVTVVRNYDIAADAKSRISLRGAKTKYFHVKVLSNGSFVLEPRVLVDPEKIPARTLKMLESSVASLKKGEVSAPIDLSPFIEHYKCDKTRDRPFHSTEWRQRGSQPDERGIRQGIAQVAGEAVGHLAVQKTKKQP